MKAAMHHTEKAQFGYTLLKPKARRDSAGDMCSKQLGANKHVHKKACYHNERHVNICTNTSKCQTCLNCFLIIIQIQFLYQACIFLGFVCVNWIYPILTCASCASAAIQYVSSGVSFR